MSLGAIVLTICILLVPVVFLGIIFLLAWCCKDIPDNGKNPDWLEPFINNLS